MKLVLAVMWQTILLVVAAFGGFVAGMVLPAVRLQRVLINTPTHVRTYDFNWIVAVAVVYLLLLLIGVLRKRSMVISATIALVLTVAGLALLTQLGVKDVAF